MKFLSQLTKKSLQNKICLLRVDLNIENADLRGFEHGLKRIKIRDNPSHIRIHPRILAVLPTIKFLLKNGAKVVILSHRGRPQNRGKRTGERGKKELSLKHFTPIFSKLLGKPVYFLKFDKSGFVSQEDILKIKNSKNGIFLVENLRFIKGEKENNIKLAKKLASLGDIYINDAFAVSHRANASVSAITKFLPSYAGLLLEKEIRNLNEVMKNPKKPLVVILGGAKISDKIGLINNFMKKADYFLIGGGIANNFVKAQGLPIGNSIFEEKTVGFAKKLLNNPKIILPDDYIVYNRKILDLGQNTIEKYSKIIKKAKTIIWNGPLGMFEDKRFRIASEKTAKSVVESKANIVIGGGETATLFNGKSKMENGKYRIFISTGGGAMLEYLGGKKLSGLVALERHN